MAPTISQPAPTSRPSRFFRTNGANAEITISAQGIFRNEVLQVQKTNAVGKCYFSYYPPPPNYDVMSAFHAMSPATRHSYIAKSWFEVVVEAACLGVETSSATLLKHLSKLSLAFAIIENIEIKIVVPVTDCTDLSKYKKSPSREVLLQVVDKLRLFTNLKKMNVVLVLPAFSPSHVDILALPFYELETFTRWRLKYQKHDNSFRELATYEDIKRINTTYSKYREEEDRLIQEEDDQVKNATHIRYGTLERQLMSRTDTVWTTFRASNGMTWKSAAEK